MNEGIPVLHYATIVTCVAATSLGVGIGGGLAGMSSTKAMDIQPTARAEIFRTMILGMAIIETAAIIGLVVSLLMLTSSFETASGYTHLAELGIMFAIALPGLVIGVVAALPVQQAVLAIARQPFFSQKITSLMLITQVMIQTSVIFGFISAILIKGQAQAVDSLAESLRLIASGVSIGLGCIGPALGLALFAQKACWAIGINRNSYNRVFSFALISQAIIETPILFAFVISLLCISTTTQGTLIAGIATLAASLAIGFGTFGPGIGSGITAAAACKQMAFVPAQYPLLSRLSMLGQGLIDTSAIYALLVALLLIFFK